MLAQDILIKPIISEKSLKDAGAGKFTFLVNDKANKTEIKRAIEEVFEVKVKTIKTNITKGSTTKNTKVGRKINFFRDKKARVTLDKGQSIAIFDEHLGKDDKQSLQSKDSKSKSKDKKVKNDEKKIEKKEEKK